VEVSAVLTPQEYKQLIAGLEGLAGRMEASPNAADRAVAGDLRKNSADLKQMAAEPMPDYAQPDFGPNLEKQVEAQAAALDKAPPEMPDGAPKEAFQPWDGVTLGNQLLKEFGFEAAIEKPEPAAAPKPPPAKPAPVPVQEHPLLRQALKKLKKPPKPEDFDSLKME
jgi:hypothetical protein